MNTKTNKKPANMKNTKQQNPIRIFKSSKYIKDKYKEDLVSIHSTATSQSDVVGRSMKYIEGRCAVETVDEVACSAENIPEICKNWCKQNNSIRKFDSVFKMLSESAPTFKFSQFDNRATFKFEP